MHVQSFLATSYLAPCVSIGWSAVAPEVGTDLLVDIIIIRSVRISCIRNKDMWEDKSAFHVFLKGLEWPAITGPEPYSSSYLAWLSLTQLQALLPSVLQTVIVTLNLPFSPACSHWNMYEQHGIVTVGPFPSVPTESNSYLKSIGRICPESYWHSDWTWFEVEPISKWKLPFKLPWSWVE